MELHEEKTTPFSDAVEGHNKEMISPFPSQL